MKQNRRERSAKGAQMEHLRLDPGDAVQLKKKHPCGGDVFRVLRAASDVRAVCVKCGRDVTFDRVRFEKSVKKIVGGDNDGET